MNKQNVVIGVRGVQVIDGEKDVMEITVVGSLCEKDGGYTLKYTEYDEESNKLETIIDIDSDGIVSMTKFGHFTTEMIFEENKRHSCHYETPYGNITMGVFTKKVNSQMCNDCGKIELEYNIDFNTGLAAENMMTITVTSG